MPYLYTAFARYHFEGIPPFRALVMDYPEDEQVWKIDDEYMMGDRLLCAPFIDGDSTRTVYLPKGTWYDFNTNKRYAGGRTYSITMTLSEIPMFVKDNTILPLARPVSYISPETTLSFDCKVYGKPTSTALFEDDTYNYGYTSGNYNWISLSWNGKRGKVERKGKMKGKLFEVKDWKVVKEH